MRTLTDKQGRELCDEAGRIFAGIVKPEDGPEVIMAKANYASGLAKMKLFPNES